MKCGKGAGCKTCLILTDKNQKIAENIELVDVAVTSLTEFGRLIGLKL